MSAGSGSHGDQFGPSGGDRLVEAGEAHRDPQPFGFTLQALSIAAHQSRHLDPCGAERRDVNAAAETCSDNQGTNACVAHLASLDVSPRCESKMKDSVAVFPSAVARRNSN